MKAYLRRLWRLSVCEWQLREQSRPSGLLWTLLQPTLMFVTLSYVFSAWLGPSTPDYRARLLIGVLQWGFFASCTAYGLSSLVRRAPILRNFALPLDLPVLSAAASVAASHAIEVLLLCAYLIAVGRAPSARWLLLLPAELTLVALAVGASLVLAWLAALYRDIERIWAVVLSIGFFLTPVFYDPSRLTGGRGALLAWNPLTRVLGFSRGALIGGTLDSAGLAASFAAGLLAAAAGLALLRRRDARLRDYLY